MTIKIVSIICLSLFLSCNEPSDKIDTTFIVPTDSMLLPKNTGNPPPPPPPPKEYYFPSNFIIDTGGHIYFYQRRIKVGWDCVSDLEWNAPPPFIGLQPTDIIEVSSQNLEDFVKLNIQYLDNSDRQFAIASVADTITSLGLSKIFSILKDSANQITWWTFRKITQEENVVLNFKKSKKKFYYSNEIKWDSTRIIFPKKVETSFEFTP